MSPHTLSELAQLMNQSRLSAETQEAVEAEITIVANAFRCSRQQAIARLGSLRQ